MRSYFSRKIQREDLSHVEGTQSSSTMNCYATFRKHMLRKPWSVSFTLEGGGSYTFAWIEWRSAQLARLFSKSHVKKGDRICIEAVKSEDTIPLYIACLRYGAIFVPLNPLAEMSELKHILEDIQPSLIICQKEKQSRFSELTSEKEGVVICTLGEQGTLSERSHSVWPLLRITEVSADTIACIIYTSGTTGEPKGVMLSHRSIALGAKTLSELWKFTADDTLLHALSLFHGYGLMALNIALYSGSRLLLLRSNSLQKIVAYMPQATVYMGTPLAYQRLCLLEGFDSTATRHVRLFISGTAPLSENVFHAFLKRTSKKIIDRYGMTETIVNASNEIGHELPGSCGRPIAATVVRVVDSEGTSVPAGEIGAIEVYSPYLFKGYWNDPKKTRAAFRADNFFITGDTGKIDEDGHVWLLGRTKDSICFGDEIFHPREIEVHIEDMVGIEASVVLQISQPTIPFYLIAIVQAQNSGEATEDKILARLGSVLPSHRIPMRIFFTEELPRNTSGKIQRNVVYEKYAAFLAAEAAS
jgi:malonyl-CoA/methylmalonyl-CoA synthetase